MSDYGFIIISKIYFLKQWLFVNKIIKYVIYTYEFQLFKKLFNIDLNIHRLFFLPFSKQDNQILLTGIMFHNFFH